MEFPDFGLVQLAPRDLTGPGVEFYARRISFTFAAVSGGFQLTADQLNQERLYMLRWAWSGLPDLASGAIVKNARWYLQLPTIDVQLWGWNGRGYAGTANERVDSNSDFIVIPGGKPLLFVLDFNALPVATHALDGWLWGYSFPKGNVLSF